MCNTSSSAMQVMGKIATFYPPLCRGLVKKGLRKIAWILLKTIILRNCIFEFNA